MKIGGIDMIGVHSVTLPNEMSVLILHCFDGEDITLEYDSCKDALHDYIKIREYFDSCKDALHDYIKIREYFDIRNEHL